MQSLEQLSAHFLIAGHDEPSIEVELTNGEIAIVDCSDAPKVLEKKWRRMGKCPFTTTEPAISMKRWIVGIDGPIVMNRNGDGLDNRRANILAPFHHTTLHADCAEIRMPGMHSAWISLDDVAVAQSRRWIIHPATNWNLLYAIGRLPGVKAGQLLHQIVMPGHAILDHADRNGLNCRRENIRPASPAQNVQNRKKQRGSSTKYKGVYPSKRRFLAIITHCGKSHYLGHFKTEEDAALAYDQKAREFFGDFARLNFPVGTERGAVA